MIESVQSGTIKVTLPDGAIREFPSGSTIQQVAFGIGQRLGKETLGGRLNGSPEIRDLRTQLTTDCALEIITTRDEDGLHVIRHSAAHILADAVLKLWPDALLAIGPSIDDGFYYDIDLEHRIGPEEFEKIEAEMARVVAADLPFERCVVDRDAVLATARAADDRYKAELLEGLGADDVVTFYRHGGFEDLCRGPHVPSTGSVKAFKLMRVAGAYWRGDEKNPMLQRIYGTAWASKKDLDLHLQRLEEAKLRDHRVLGRELDLFLFDPVAPACPFFLPKGAIVYNALLDYMRSLYLKYGYQEVLTPQIFDLKLWHTSGHYEHYKENMFFTAMDETEAAVKPMNCPGHTFIYGAQKRSYRELPLRIADFGRLHRYERSGVTSGLTRVRSFSQDDAHIFCAPEQIQSEISGFLELVKEVYATFGFDDITINLSTRPEKSVGSDETWERAEKGLKDALSAHGVSYRTKAGDGAFYGPKIDFDVRDALKRSWQLATCQLDFSMPERFDLRYTAKSGIEERPVMIHRAVLGSVERFMGILIEHTAGALPVWLAPEQARILTINDSHQGYAEQVAARLRNAGYRVAVDASNAKTGAKIREARNQRVPFRLVVGDSEVAANAVAVKERPDQDHGVMSVDRFEELLADRLRSRQ